MKLRIIESVLKAYTGFMGGVEFVNGLSVRDVNDVEKNMIASNVRVEDAESGLQQGASAELVAMHNKNAEIVKPLEQSAPEPEKEIVVKEIKYTPEDLAKIADEKGIAGLRETGEEFGVKGTSIVGLIKAILTAQSK